MNRTATDLPAASFFPRRQASLALVLVLGSVAALGSATALESAADSLAEDAVEDGEARFLSNTRQLTFEGKRAGEGYFSRDGSLMIFQSERQADNPFYQIYLLDLNTGDINRVSPGHGKMTCFA